MRILIYVSGCVVLVIPTERFDLAEVCVYWEIARLNQRLCREAPGCARRLLLICTVRSSWLWSMSCAAAGCPLADPLVSMIRGTRYKPGANTGLPGSGWSIAGVTCIPRAFFNGPPPRKCVIKSRVEPGLSECVCGRKLGQLPPGGVEVDRCAPDLLPGKV